MKHPRFPALPAIVALAIASTTPALAGVSRHERCATLVEERRASELQAIAELALKISPTDAEANYYLGVSLMLQDKHAEAIAQLDKAVAANPASSEYHRALGDAHGLAALRASMTRALSHAKKGRAALGKAVELDPKNTQARISLAMFYVHAPGIAGGSKKKGWEQIAEIEKLDPEAAWRMRVLASIAGKQHVEARALLDAKLAAEPGCYFALTQVGRISYETNRNPDEGITVLKQALQKPQDRASPGHARVQYWLGALHERLKDKPSARAAYQAAATLSPGVKEFGAALARLK
jgi:tetratricopeptide (TPR) repeat protein